MVYTNQLAECKNLERKVEKILKAESLYPKGFFALVSFIFKSNFELMAKGTTFDGVHFIGLNRCIMTNVK